jgi:protease-4
MSYRTLSAILRHDWLISQEYVQQHMPLILKMVNGEVVDFGLEKKEDPEPKILHQLALAGPEPAAAVYGVYPSSNLASLPVGSIAQVDIVGPVLKYGDMCSYGMNDTAALINRLAQNGNVSAIILNVDSPGGQASGTQQLADAIKSATTMKPVVAIIDDGMAASAAMWIVSAATEIYLTKKTDAVGSIGVYTTLADWQGYAESQGLKMRDVYAPQSTDKNGPVREALAGNDVPLQNDLAQMADAFINAIQTNRGSKLTSDEWNTGKMFNAKQATKIGLVDGVKPYSQVIKRTEQLIQNRQSKNSTNMTAFAKFMAAANITEISVVDGGFLVSEETLNAVENKLTENETAISGHQAAVAQLNQTIQQRDASIAALENPATFADQMAAKDQIIAGLQTQIQAKDQKIQELSGKPAKEMTTVPAAAAGDHMEGEQANKFLTSFDQEKAILKNKFAKK